jgi:hypothetical protein
VFCFVCDYTCLQAKGINPKANPTNIGTKTMVKQNYTTLETLLDIQCPVGLSDPNGYRRTVEQMDIVYTNKSTAFSKNLTLLLERHNKGTHIIESINGVAIDTVLEALYKDLGF